MKFAVLPPVRAGVCADPDWMMGFAGHAVGFTAFGTVVRLIADEHRNLGARMVLPMDDPVVGFDAASLRGD